jgi:hypothetical protein
MLFDLPVKVLPGENAAVVRDATAKHQLSIDIAKLPDNARHVWLIWEENKADDTLILKLGFGAYARQVDAVARCRILNQQTANQCRSEHETIKDYLDLYPVCFCEKYDNPAFKPVYKRRKEKKV